MRTTGPVIGSRPSKRATKPSRKMQVTSLLSRKELQLDAAHDDSCESCGHDHEHAPVRLWQILVGVVLVVNAFIVDWAFENSHTVASVSSFLGAIALGYPI